MPSSEDNTAYESPKIVAEALGNYIYHGASMNGTFRFGDRLVVEEVALAEVRPGDVLIYRTVTGNRNTPGNVVHRVIGMTPEGGIVRGDSNPNADRDLVTDHNVIGRVIRFERDGRLRSVYGGRAGLLKGRFLYVKYSIRRLASRLAWYILAATLRKPYRWLRSSGVVRRVWSPPVTRVHLQTDEGLLIKYVVRNRTVACCWPQSNRFWCRKPYDLVISKPTAIEQNDQRETQGN